MRTLLALALASLAVLTVACAPSSSCEHLNDCPGGLVCNAGGECVEREARAIIVGGGGRVQGANNNDDEGDDGDLDGDDGFADEATGSVEELEMRDVTLTGDIGPIHGFNGAATASGSVDEDFGVSWVTLMANTADGSGLFMLFLESSLRDLPVGETRFSGSNDTSWGTYVQLCSDAADYSVHFDGIAEDVVIVVTDGPDGREVDIDATIVEGFDGVSYSDEQPTVVSAHFAL